jgi:hypothetical protein
MTGKRVTITKLFDELRAKNLAEYNRPGAEEAREAARLRRQQIIDAEIAAGLRDEDGEPIEEPGADDDLDEEDEYDPDAEPEEF